MGEKVLDLQGKSFETIMTEDIPNDTTDAILSNNNFTVLPSDLFNKTTKIWRIDFKRNYLTDLSFMSAIKALGRFDISYNQLEIDELLQFRHVYIVFLISAV